MFHSKLEGVRVALLEARMSGELAELIRRHGGAARCVPAVREGTLDCAEQVSSFLDRLTSPGPRVVVFLTGVGATALFREAERQSRFESLLKALTRATIVCRGPKPTAVLRRHGISVGIAATEPYTTTELIQALDGLELRATDVTLVHYGERNQPLAEALMERGAFLEELCLYEWLMPEDLQPLKDLVCAVLDGHIDALVLTSQIQCRHLFKVAAHMQLGEPLANALSSRVVVAAIGPICRAALEEFGVAPHVVPATPKMGPLVSSLADHFAASRRGSAPDKM